MLAHMAAGPDAGVPLPPAGTRWRTGAARVDTNSTLTALQAALQPVNPQLSQAVSVAVLQARVPCGSILYLRAEEVGGSSTANGGSSSQVQGSAAAPYVRLDCAGLGGVAVPQLCCS